MTKKNSTLEGRRTMIKGLGVAAAGLTLAATSARAQTRAFRPAREEIDAWMGEMPGQHRIFVDTATTNGAAEGLLYSNNLYNAQVNDYGGSNADLAMILCFRHFSTPFGYGDAIWKKYGQVFAGLMSLSETTDATPDINLFNAADRTDLPNFGVTVDAVVAKGTQIAICSAATQFISGQLAEQTGGSADDIRAELIAGALPNSRFVPAGVMALTRSQEYGYSVLIAG